MRPRRPPPSVLSVRAEAQSTLSPPHSDRPRQQRAGGRKTTLLVLLYLLHCAAEACYVIQQTITFNLNIHIVSTSNLPVLAMIIALPRCIVCVGVYVCVCVCAIVRLYEWVVSL